MTGAREFAGLFKTGQYGQLYITSGDHARGKTFHIQVLPKNEDAKENYGNMCTNDNAVEVYGVISGNPGWTETYGWLHKGKWIDDFNSLVAKREKEEMNEQQKNDLAKQKRELIKKEREKGLLNNY